jgi:hypothetical protein
MAHIELLNTNSELTEKELHCHRDPCHPELGGGGHTMGTPTAEQEHEEEAVEGPIQPCHWP